MTEVHHSSRCRFEAIVEANDLICREHYRLRLRVVPEGASLPPTVPGQFIQVGCRPPAGAGETEPLDGQEHDWTPGMDEHAVQLELVQPLALLRRPISLAARGDDERGTWLELIHRVVGTGTGWLSRLKIGDAVDAIGPLGNGFTLPAGKRVALLVGGGVGLPPMSYLATTLAGTDWARVAFIGAQSADLLAVAMRPDVAIGDDGSPTLAVEPFASAGCPVAMTTDDGSLGLKGFVTDSLSRFLDTLDGDALGDVIVFTCGPNPMMRAVAKLAAERGVDCQVSLEQAMACGMGTCQSCVVKMTDLAGQPAHGTTNDGRAWRYRLTCTDGPVFNAKDVVWG